MAFDHDTSKTHLHAMRQLGLGTINHKSFSPSSLIALESRNKTFTADSLMDNCNKKTCSPSELNCSIISQLGPHSEGAVCTVHLWPYSGIYTERTKVCCMFFSNFYGCDKLVWLGNVWLFFLLSAARESTCHGFLSLSRVHGKILCLFTVTREKNLNLDCFKMGYWWRLELLSEIPTRVLQTWRTNVITKWNKTCGAISQIDVFGRSFFCSVHFYEQVY